MLNFEDWFAVGLGLDIAGAGLLAKGLLLRPAQIGAGGTFGGIASMGLLALRDRVDAEFGLAYLLGGFVFQIIGYTALQAGAESEGRGTGEAVAFVALAATAVALAVVTYLLARGARKRALAKRVVQEYRHSKQIVSWGREIGEEPRSGETYREYGLRVFGVEPGDNQDEPIEPD